MPEAIGTAIITAAEAIFFGGEMIFTAGQIYTVGQIAIAAVSIGAGQAQQRRAMRRARAAYNASLKDREVTIRSAVSPRRRIYGRDRVSGPVVYAQSTGDKSQYLHLVIALAAHECDAIETVYFGNQALPDGDEDGYIQSGAFVRTTRHAESYSASASGGSITLPRAADSIAAVSHDPGGDAGQSLVSGYSHAPGSAVVSGLPTSGTVTVSYEWAETAPLVRVRKYLGAAGQTADPDLITESGGLWTADHVGVGICYLYVRLEYDHEVFAQIGVPEIKCVVRGAKVLDPRDGITRWTDNAALIAADWLRDATYGLGASSDEVPTSEVVAAANICDEPVNLGEATQPRYTFNGSFTTDVSPRDMLADIMASMAGSCVWVQGRWLMRPGAYRSPSLTITADDLAGDGVRIVPKASRSSLFNAVRVTARDPAQDWAEVQAPLVANATYQAQDGGRQIVRAVQYESAMDWWRAQRLGKIELERARQALTVQFTASLRGYDLVPTDTVTLQLDRYGWSSGKVFEILERTHDLAAGTIAYTARETASGVYAWVYGDATSVDLAPDTELPSPYSRPAALGNLSLTVGSTANSVQSDGTTVPGVRLEWDAPTDVFVIGGGWIDVQWQRQGDADWVAAPPAAGSTTATLLSPVPDGVVLLVRVRPVRANGVAGDWLTRATIPQGDNSTLSVSGLTGTVTKGFIVWSWTQPTSTLYASTELRQGGTGWDDATTVWGGGANSWTQRVTSAGSYTIRAKHRTHAWTPSTTAASATVTVAPEDLVLDGAPGVNAATVWLFQRTASATPPAVPSGDVTYVFSTGVATGIGSWAQALPGSGGSYRWFTTATASASTATDTIATGEWAAPRLMSDATGALAGLDTVGTDHIDADAVSRQWSLFDATGVGYSSIT